LRIQNLRPGADTEIAEASNPLELALRDAIAENKGCYPGQEVVEKIVALGSPARRLVLLKGDLPWPQQLREDLFDPENPDSVWGQLTSLSTFNKGYIALGLVRKIHAKVGLRVKVGAQGASATIAQIASYEQTPLESSRPIGPSC